MENEVKQTALDSYDKIINLLENIFKSWKETFQKEFDIRVGLNCFDVLLQFSMLQIALNDGQLQSEELEFIRDISKYCNICDYFNQRGYQNVEWQNILNTDESTLKEILNGLQEDIIDISMDFVNIFSYADAAISKYNFFDSLKNNIFNILIAVASADNNADKSEFNWCIIFATLNEIAKRKQAYIDAFNNPSNPNGENTNKKSLKDFYVKKR